MAKFSSVRVGVCEGVSIVARAVHSVAEDVLGAAKNGSVKVFGVTCVVHRYRGAGRGAGLSLLGARAARALIATLPPPQLSLRSWRYAEMGAQLGSSVAFGSGCGQALPGVPRKAPLCSSRTSID